MFLATLRFLQSWKRYNTSLRELSHLGDRELADIGISRSDIPRVAWAARSVVTALKGGIPDNVYNRDVIPRWKERFGGASVSG